MSGRGRSIVGPETFHQATADEMDKKTSKHKIVLWRFARRIKVIVSA